MSLHIQVDGPGDLSDHVSRLQAAAEETLLNNGRQAGSLTIKLTDDETMRQFHRDYLNEDKTTDVLSFPHGEIDPESGLPYFGDILISVPQARSQALQGGHSLQAELTLLVVHGTLHLLGFDHADPEAKERMWEQQRRILRSLEAEIEGPAGDET